MRILASGTKSFVLRYTADGRDRIATVGQFPTWSLTAARKRAQELRKQIDAGADPLQEQRARQAAKAEAKAQAEREHAARERYTLKDLCAAYVAHLEAQGKASRADAASLFKVWLLERHARIAATPARDVTPEQIAIVVRAPLEAGKRRTAGALRSYLAAAFTAARKAPFNANLPAALIPFQITADPVAPIATVPAATCDRVLSAAELGAYLNALGTSPTDEALRLALYAGGQRFAQLLRARVADYDPAHHTLLLWDAKGRRREPRAHLLPLAPVAAGIAAALAERARQQAEREAKRTGKPAADSPPLFLSRASTPAKPMVPDTLSKRVYNISAALGTQPFDARALRRTAETQMAAIGISKDLRAHLLSHGMGGIQTQHYDRHDYLSEKRAALVAWEAHLTALAGAKREAG